MHVCIITRTKACWHRCPLSPHSVCAHALCGPSARRAQCLCCLDISSGSDRVDRSDTVEPWHSFSTCCYYFCLRSWRVVAGAAATALVLRWTESLERMTFFFCRSFYYLCCCYLRFAVQDARSFPIIHPPAGLSCGRNSGCASSGRVRIGEADEVTLTKAMTTQQKLVAFDDVVIFAHLKRPNRPKWNPIEKEDLKDTNRLTSRVERQAGKQLATSMNRNEKSSRGKYCESPHAQREDCRNR